MKRPIKVCFISPYNYPLFNPSINTKFGGFEVQIYNITRELAKSSEFAVSLIVADHGQPEREIREGVEIIPWTGQRYFGIPAPNTLDVESNSSLPNINFPEGGSNDPDRSEVDQHVDLAQPVSTVNTPRAQVWKNLRRKIQSIYKCLIPWKLRIVLHGFFGGFEQAAQYIIKVMHESTNIFIGAVRYNRNLARIAFAEINDQPVYFEQVEIFEKVDADIYVVPGNSQNSALAACYCKQRRRAFVMLAGSDMDFLPEIKDNPLGYDIYMAPHAWKLYAIQKAAVVIVQNEDQASMASYFGVSPVLIRNPFNLELQYSKVENPQNILWVGNTNEQVKRPQLLLELAQQLPEYQFTMILTPNVQEIYERYRLESQKIQNLNFMSRVPFDKIEQFFANAKILVNTSSFEGFPNTFLQAGKYGLPVVSLNVDPSGMLNRNHCGFYCENDLELLRRRIQQLMEDWKVYQQISQNILDYVRKYHDQDIVIPQYAQVLKDVAPLKTR